MRPWNSSDGVRALCYQCNEEEEGRFDDIEIATKKKLL